MWLQNQFWLAALTALVLLSTCVQAKGEDTKNSGDVKIVCHNPTEGEDETTLSLSVVDKSLNDLEPLVQAMCAGHTSNGAPTLWEASWKDKPELGTVSNFKMVTTPEEVAALDLTPQDFGQVDFDSNDITADVTMIEDKKPAQPVQSKEKPPQSPPEEVEVKTYLGKLKGYRNKLDKGEGHIYSFLGIPYAQPPTGSRRFKPPLPVTAYKDDQAFGFRSECAQIKAYGPKKFQFVGSEDCLFVNIFSPSLTHNKEALKPVMIWFHGGAFTMGAGNEYIPVEMVRKGVVVVTVNYRLGALGFLTFGNDIVAGNMGLKDQLEAMRWVKRFIHNFGGDPEQVTLFGQSSGALMVNAMQMSPKATGLFKAAIVQSGNMLMRRVTAEGSDEKRTAKGLAEKAECPSDYSEAMLKCMQNLPAEGLIKMSGYAAPNLGAPKEDRERGPWFPVVDSYATDPILPMEPLNALKTGMFNKVPLMTGTVANDGAIQVMSILGPNPTREAMWQQMAAHLLMVGDSANVTETKYEDVILASLATKYYTGEDYNLEEKIQPWIDLFTDALFLSPDQKLVELVRNQEVPVYNYQFTLKPDTSIASIFGIPDNSVSPVNGEDILMLFDQFENIHLKTDRETKIGDMMIEYWTNFAKYGNPSPFDNPSLPKWKPVTNQKEYLEISEAPEMKYNIQPERITFWQRMLWDSKEDHIDRMMLYGKLSKLFLLSNKNTNEY
jgi:carboxylesterase type B